jgi:hypothetical protein
MCGAAVMTLHFTSWRHHRLELIAIWQLRRCNLALNGDLSPRHDFTYEIL